jgi:hypothetical protein
MHVKVRILLLSKHTAAYYEGGPLMLFKEIIAGFLLCVTNNIAWRKRAFLHLAVEEVKP